MQWAHPKYENLIATCGYDKKIKIWKEVKAQSWDIVYEFEAEASVHPFFLQEPRVNAIITIARIKYVFFIIFIFIKDITNFLKNKAKKNGFKPFFIFQTF